MAIIKNIILDLGGVLLNIDYNRTATEFKKLGMHNFEEFYSQAAANDLFEALETGAIPEPAFYETIRNYCLPGTTALQIQQAWNAILLDFRMESLAYLEVLKDKYQLFLLSNTNSIHHTAFEEIYRKATGKQSLNDAFIKACYSHELKKRKPYKETYVFMLNELGLLAEETLFIDDSVVNIEGAIEAGLQVHLLKPEERIENLGL